MTSALRGAFLSYTGNPFKDVAENTYRYESDGLIVIADGKITYAGAYEANRVPAGVTLEHHRDGLIIPGFIDAHVHYPQMPMVGAYGKKLLEWLDKYVFVTEQRYRDKTFARQVAKVFLREQIKAGVTTPITYATVHPEAVDAYFEEAELLGLRTGTGKVLMNRNAPEGLRDTTQTGYDQSKALAEKWHHRGRFFYVVTPRFAPTSTPDQLEAAGALFKEIPGAYMQTHISENTDELKWVQELFPDNKNYLDVYDHFGLVGPRALFGHGVHLVEAEWQRLAEAGATIVHCPTSNLFLGSGLFNLERALVSANPVRTALGSDIGAGTSFSPLVTLNEAYKVAQLRNFPLSAHQAFYLATLGSARAIYQDQHIGSIEAGKDADLTVLDFLATPLLAERESYARSLDERLFILMTLGDDRAIKATYVAGRKVHTRD
ncbi:guanine deaminase [Methylocella sp. CPCC 101449]|uniref:guanine deaminase n=1 Tax=Methylocella sp. CPCC 101449 TaxID=2987531 RepID=UPI00288CEF25|nr:guanine deaminase [Methylocella sp. CPCC 101449]MDT2020848.1 guanine deaminase [Methylocella sp. CPCC 101449]